MWKNIKYFFTKYWFLAKCKFSVSTLRKEGWYHWQKIFQPWGSFCRCTLSLLQFFLFLFRMNLDGLDRKLIYTLHKYFLMCHHFVASKVSMKSHNLDDGLMINPETNNVVENISDKTKQSVCSYYLIFAVLVILICWVGGQTGGWSGGGQGGEDPGVAGHGLWRAPGLNLYTGVNILPKSV